MTGLVILAVALLQGLFLLGVPYFYDVDNAAEATGDPTITWSALLAPMGFQIGATDGAVAWIPAAAGPQGVCLVASNSAGEDTQCFTVIVAASGPPPEEPQRGPERDDLEDAARDCAQEDERGDRRRHVTPRRARSSGRGSPTDRRPRSSGAAASSR